MSWLCPLCHTSLREETRSLCCPHGHRYDKAKEGYVNLLPVQYKHSRDPGDNAAMVQARRDFLDAGHYQPLRDALTENLENFVPRVGPQILDIGCGEGYYTGHFASLAAKREGQCWGLDVSRTAVRAAAKRHRQAKFCVASSKRLPFADLSLDAVVRIYAPCHPAELARVVRPGGIVLTAAPGAHHLMELKGLIYSQIKLHPSSQENLAGFTLSKMHSLVYPMTLSGLEACALLQMTPFAWRAKSSVWDYLAERSEFTCKADFRIQLWKRDQL